MYNIYLDSFHDFQSMSNEFQKRLAEQRAEDGTLFSEAAALLDKTNDAAFEGLETLVVQLLQIADGDSPVGKDAVPQLPIAIELFHKLAKSCEGSVDRIGQEFIDTTQYGGENKQLHDDIQKLLVDITGEIRSAEGALQRAQDSSRSCFERLTTARRNLKDAENKKDDWYAISSFFGGGGDIDNQIRVNEQNVKDCQRNLDDAETDEIDCENNLSNLQSLVPRVQELTRLLDDLFWQMNAEYEKIVEDRKIIERTWVATRTLDYHVSTNDVDTSRDDILRHVIQLIHIRVEQVDEDPDVQRFKENIERRMREALGEALVEELHQERRFLPKEDVNF
ncbi:hypothetical protein CPAR01_07370 [Colletotrichum paranaense]|uniref:Fungal N-terminal domain-containing protein n=1 Tax=Colletotrichum paranaense TaxID=1914294 RepID=A0ABQ9SPF0_9PEZI|nr:uncharacterized protein CPAR01_07370 [Colletotrichum paranaense]KAK1541381.1 hypothetical protein CPAR01_07370 [Colletotrichum paranaense]